MPRIAYELPPELPNVSSATFAALRSHRGYSPAGDRRAPAPFFLKPSGANLRLRQATSRPAGDVKDTVAPTPAENTPHTSERRIPKDGALYKYCLFGRAGEPATTLPTPGHLDVVGGLKLGRARSLSASESGRVTRSPAPLSSDFGLAKHKTLAP